MQLSLFKTCSICKTSRFITDFRKDKNRKDGRFPYCKYCTVKDAERYENKKQGLKRCPDCKQWLSQDKFYSNKDAPDGLSYQCRTCAGTRAKNWKHVNPEAYKKKIWNLTWSNPEQRKQKFKDYYEKHADEQRARVLQYSKTEQGKATQARQNHRRRSWVKSAPATLTDSEWTEIIKRQGNMCAICKVSFSGSVKPTRDHIVPVSRGGGLTKENVQALCKPCNSRKKDKAA